MNRRELFKGAGALAVAVNLPVVTAATAHTLYKTAGAPRGPVAGDVWLDTSTRSLHIYGPGSRWRPAT